MPAAPQVGVVDFLHHHITMKALALFALVALLGVAFGQRTLVVVDSRSVKDTHSTFFKALTGNTQNLCD